MSHTPASSSTGNAEQGGGGGGSSAATPDVKEKRNTRILGLFRKISVADGYASISLTFLHI